MDTQILNNAGFFQAVFILLGIILIYKGLVRMFSYNVNEKPASKSTTRRRVGRNEALMYVTSEERQGTTDICLILTLRSKTEMIKDYVREALVLLAKRQPMLRAIITTSGGSDTATIDKYFEIIDGDEIADMIDFTSSEVKARLWQDVWQQVSFKERGTRLLWKVVMLQEEFLSETQCYANTLIFNVNHSCIDGISSMKFCQQFLHYLNGLADGSVTSDEDISSLSLWPSFVDLVTREMERSWSRWQFLVSCLGIPHLTKLILRKVVRWTLSRKQCNPFFSRFPPIPKPATPSNSNMICKVFSENETSNIVKACRLNGCTVTGALMAANHLAFCNLLRDGRYKCNDAQLDYSCAINGQRAFQPKPPEEYLGFFACGLTLLFPYTDDESCFWRLANEATRRIQNELKSEKYIKQHVGLLDWFSTIEIVNELFSPLDRETFIRVSMCTAMSSIGSFDFREEQKNHRYKLHECIFSLLVHNLSFVFAHFNTTVNGKMSWAIKYDPSKVTNDSQAQKFANLCFGYLMKICQ